MLAEVWATYHDSRHFTMAMMYTRRLPLHPAVSSLLGNFYTVVPLEVDLRAGCSLNGLLEGLQAETLVAHVHNWYCERVASEFPWDPRFQVFV